MSGWIEVHPTCVCGNVWPCIEGFDSSKPIGALKSAYASKEEAIEVWRNIKGNENLAVVGCFIGLGSFTPAKEAACWIILPIQAVV